MLTRTIFDWTASAYSDYPFSHTIMCFSLNSHPIQMTSTELQEYSNWQFSTLFLPVLFNGMSRDLCKWV